MNVINEFNEIREDFLEEIELGGCRDLVGCFHEDVFSLASPFFHLSFLFSLYIAHEKIF